MMKTYNSNTYLDATRIELDKISATEIADFVRERRQIRNNIIRDLFQKLIKDNDSCMKINNPIAYNFWYNSLKNFQLDISERIEKLERKEKKTNSAKNHKERVKLIESGEYFENDDIRELEQYKVDLGHLRKRIEILKLLFNKYVETDWSEF